MRCLGGYFPSPRCGPCKEASVIRGTGGLCVCPGLIGRHKGCGINWLLRFTAVELSLSYCGGIQAMHLYQEGPTTCMSNHGQSLCEEQLLSVGQVGA
jgi:hypothetical protein